MAVKKILVENFLNKESGCNTNLEDIRSIFLNRDENTLDIDSLSFLENLALQKEKLLPVHQYANVADENIEPTF